MKKLLFGCSLMVLAAVSCKKTTTSIQDSGTPYMTMDSGSVWNYESFNNIDTTSTTYTLTATGTDTTVNSRVYRIFNRLDSSGLSSEYYNISVNDYYQYTSLSAQLPPLELKYLVNNAGVGTSWEQPLEVSQNQSGITLDFNATLRYTVVETGGTITVASNTYNNVIKVKTEIINPTISSSLPIPISIEPIIQDINAYYAPRQGLVKRDFLLSIDINLLGTIQNIINNNTSTSLISSNIP
jgi:hypothetical protein